MFSANIQNEVVYLAMKSPYSLFSTTCLIQKIAQVLTNALHQFLAAIELLRFKRISKSISLDPKHRHYCLQQCLLGGHSLWLRMQRLYVISYIQLVFVLYNGCNSLFAVSQASSLGDLSILLKFSCMRTGTRIVIFGAWLKAGNFLATLTSVFYISEAKLSTSFKTVEEGKRSVTRRVITLEDGRIETLQAVCLSTVRTAQTQSNLSALCKEYWWKCSNWSDPKGSRWQTEALLLTRGVVAHLIVQISLVFDKDFFTELMVRLLTKWKYLFFCSLWEIVSFLNRAKYTEKRNLHVGWD